MLISIIYNVNYWFIIISEFAYLSTYTEIKERASKEMADIFIYLLSMSHDLGIDLIEAAAKKLEESHARYPVEKSRVISKKYTEPK
jgi:NTP pyrophosphatase (non-canonical NTP hydrolase)